MIFEWNPTTNTYMSRVNLTRETGFRPTTNSLTSKDGKFYGLTNSGGADNLGVIFEWDPATNIYTKKVDLNSSTGYYPLENSLTLRDEKFYGLTYNGGTQGKGVIFEWDPVTNIYTKKVDLSTASGAHPHGDLTIIPAPAAVAPGVPNSCETYPAVTIDESNNNTWVPVTDQGGRAVAEIKANGNNLGEVNVSLYTHSGELRENTDHKLFLDRSLTITAQNNRLLPGTWVDLRLYILRDEYDVLAASVNSPEQAGLSSIQDLGVFKTHDNTCGAAISEPAVRIEATAGAWDGNYVFTLKTASFSSFHFAPKSPSDPLPVSLLSFTAEATPARAVQLEWATTQERNAAYFGVERSRDARRYEEIARIATKGKTHETTTYIHIDESPPRGRNYYRLRQVDQDGKFAYSRIVSIYGSETRFEGTPAPYPNPSKHGVIRIEARENIALRLTDLSGKEIPFTKRRIDAEITELTPCQSLQPGIYLVLKNGIGYKVIVE